MNALQEEMKRQLSNLNPKMIRRYLHDIIDWDARLISILGARGVGKTTLLLQHIQETGDVEHSLFVFADNIYFTRHTLLDLAGAFYRNGGKYLYIDEIHKYPNWSTEIKNIYDSYPTLKVVYTGSSILDLEKGGADLSRRKLQYHMYGLSFREFVELKYGQQIRVHSLQDLIAGHIDWPYQSLQPLPAFAEYLRYGYYPYFTDGHLENHLYGSVLQTLEVDIPTFAQMNVGTIRKLKTLLGIIAASVPFKPNMQGIARDLGMSRNDISDLFYYLEKAGMIAQLRQSTEGIALLGKVDKVYLNNTNLMYLLASDKIEIGNVRETFFLSATQVTEHVLASTISDFQIGEYTFEVGGKKKGKKQLAEATRGIVVRDDIEYYSPDIVPLFAFGLLY